MKWVRCEGSRQRPVHGSWTYNEHHNTLAQCVECGLAFQVETDPKTGQSGVIVFHKRPKRGKDDPST